MSRNLGRGASQTQYIVHAEALIFKVSANLSTFELDPKILETFIMSHQIPSMSHQNHGMPHQCPIKKCECFERVPSTLSQKNITQGECIAKF